MNNSNQRESNQPQRGPFQQRTAAHLAEHPDSLAERVPIPRFARAWERLVDLVFADI
jgi:hypothetical protein